MCYPTVDTDQMIQPVCGAYDSSQTVPNECECSSTTQNGFQTMQDCIDNCYLGACCTETLDDMDPVVYQNIMEGLDTPPIVPCCTVTSKNACTGTWRGIGTRCEVIQLETYQINAGCFGTVQEVAMCNPTTNSCSLGLPDFNAIPAWIGSCSIPNVGENPCCSSDNYSSSCPEGKCCGTYNSTETSASGNLCMPPRISINSLSWCGEDASPASSGSVDGCDLFINAPYESCYVITSASSIGVVQNGDSVEVTVTINAIISETETANFTASTEWVGSIVLNGKEAYCAVGTSATITNWSIPQPSIPQSCLDPNSCINTPPVVTLKLNS